MYLIFQKLSQKMFSIRQLQFPFSMFLLKKEIPLITIPILINKLISHIFIIERHSQLSRSIIINPPLSMKSIHIPTTIISYTTSRIKKTTLTMHLIIFPMTLIITTIVVVENTLTPTFVIFCLTHIFCTNLVLDHFLLETVLKRLYWRFVLGYLFYCGIVTLILMCMLGRCVLVLCVSVQGSCHCCRLGISGILLLLGLLVNCRFLCCKYSSHVMNTAMFFLPWEHLFCLFLR